MELQTKHIANIRVLLNRKQLVQLLPTNAVVAEIGVDEGSFSAKILEFSQPKKLHLIDSWNTERYNIQKQRQVEALFATEIESGQVQIHVQPSEIALKTFPNYYFDWLYIDTSHSYKQTAKELKLARIKVKEGGIIAGHDYTLGNIAKGLEYGVIKAVNEFCVQHNWEMIYLTHESHRYLSYALRAIL